MSEGKSKHLTAYGECLRCLEPFLVKKPDGSVSPLRLGEVVEKGSVISNGCVCPFPFPAELVEPITGSFEYDEDEEDDK